MTLPVAQTGVLRFTAKASAMSLNDLNTPDVTRSITIPKESQLVLAGIEWSVFAERCVHLDGTHFLQIYLLADVMSVIPYSTKQFNSVSKSWNAKVQMVNSLLHPDTSKPIYSVRPNVLLWYTTNFCTWQKAIDDGFICDDLVTVEVKFTIQEAHGVREVPCTDFTVATRRTDAVLVVEETRLHVSKGILAVHSTYFDALFFSDFKESKSEEFQVEAVDLKTFTTFLHICYQESQDSFCFSIQDWNVESLLEVADRFGSQTVINQCEDWLRDTAKVDRKRKIALADKYRLPVLKIEGIESPREMKELRETDDYKNFSVDTLSLLLGRALHLAPLE